MTQTAAHTAADALIARIADGTVVFQRDTREAGSPWRIIGRADIIAPGHHVDVTKADGTTKRVQVYAISRSGERNGVSYAIALFRDVLTARRSDPRKVTYREVHSPSFGRGRVYSNEPGATYYESTPGSGRFTVQTWEN